MGKYDGKTLLMLGSNSGAVEVVRKARNEGAYTLVADYFDESRSAAKLMADEGLLVSTADLDGLSDVVLQRKVDGILAGVSEFNLLNAMELSRRFDLPFYCTKEQWEMVESKDRFRVLCEDNCVPCPRTFFIGSDSAEIPWESIVYPVVLKPVDACSSKGVHICRSKEDVLSGLNDAFCASSAKRIIIEQFVSGDEFTAHYTICRGKASLSCIDNRYPVSVHEGNVTTIPVARLYPCVYLDRYLELANPAMLRLCESIGVTDGVLFIQGIYDSEHDSIAVFEAGLRSAAESPCRFIECVNGVNYMDVLLDHALLGYSDFDLSKDDPTLNGRCCGIVSFVAKGGVVGKIEGLEKAVAETPSVISFESRYPVGALTPDGDTLRQLMIRFVMDCTDRNQMARDIAYLNEHVVVEDVDGNDMVIRMDPKRVYGVK